MVFNKRSQIFSADMAFAVVTFIIIIISSVWIADYSREKIELSELRNDLELISRISLASLVETPGNPSNWEEIDESGFNEENIYCLGLARSYSPSNQAIRRIGKSAGLTINNYLVLDESKIQRLIELSPQKYSTYKRILGILGPNYEFQLMVKAWNGTSYNTQYEVGATPGSGVRNIVRADRFALLNGTWADVMIKVWKECDGITC
jgi:hypothetical protein